MYVEGCDCHFMSYPQQIVLVINTEIFMEQLFSAKEVCAIFKISPATLSRRVVAGDFPPPRKIYPHGDNRWTQSAIDGVFASMPIADAYKESGYQEKHAQCA